MIGTIFAIVVSGWIANLIALYVAMANSKNPDDAEGIGPLSLFLLVPWLCIPIFVLACVSWLLVKIGVMND